MEELKITTAEGNNAARILTLQGPLTLRTIFDFQAVGRQDASSSLIIDLSGVPYMDSAGLGSILGLYASAQRKQAGFAVVGASDRIKTLLQVTHVEDVLPSFATVADAEASMAKVAGA
jgi:anti-sigma B factor antagonist